MARFFGKYEHSLDVKGRLILPAAYRNELGTHAFLSQYLDRCLAVWTPEEFEKRLAEMEERQDASRADRNLARFWSSGSTEVEIDRQGRMSIPAHLREFAHLDGDVLVAGVINRLELWNPGEWAQRIAPSEQRFTEEDDTQDTQQD